MVLLINRKHIQKDKKEKRKKKEEEQKGIVKSKDEKGESDEIEKSKDMPWLTEYWQKYKTCLKFQI